MNNPIVLSMFASGYKRLYRNDEEEVRANLGENAAERGGGVATFDPENPALHWWPTTIDFKAEALRRPPAVGVADFNALVKAIKAYKQLKAAYWFGHGAAGELQFGNGKKITMDELKTSAKADVSESFDREGEIWFVACNAGQDRAFLQALSNKLRVAVRGYKTGVRWHIKYEGDRPKRTIIWRGLRDGLPEPQIRCTPQ